MTSLEKWGKTASSYSSRLKPKNVKINEMCIYASWFKNYAAKCEKKGTNSTMQTKNMIFLAEVSNTDIIDTELLFFTPNKDILKTPKINHRFKPFPLSFCVSDCCQVSATWCWTRSTRGTCNRTFCSSLWRTYSTFETTSRSSSWVPRSTQRSFLNILVCSPPKDIPKFVQHQSCSFNVLDISSFSSTHFPVFKPLDNCQIIHIPGLTFPVREFLLEDIVEMTR